jgi:hypothetical protein
VLSVKHEIRENRDNSEFSDAEAHTRLAREPAGSAAVASPRIATGSSACRPADRRSSSMDGMSRIALVLETHALACPTDANVTDPSAKQGPTAIYFLFAAACVRQRGPSKNQEMATYRRQAAPPTVANPAVARPLRVTLRLSA